MHTCDREVSPDRIGQTTIPAAVCGKSPLTEINGVLFHMNVKLLLGADIPPAQLNDNGRGRVLERPAKAGTNKVLGAVEADVMKSSALNTSDAHPDTTEHVVRGSKSLMMGRNTLSRPGKKRVNCGGPFGRRGVVLKEGTGVPARWGRSLRVQGKRRRAVNNSRRILQTSRRW